MIPMRAQQTIGKTAEISGFGMFTGSDATLRFVPAPPDHGIVFRRVDLPDSPSIPALVEYAVKSHRRTVLSHQGASVEMVEHVMACFAGLQIDNCLVELDSPEVPGFDGSSAPILDCIDEAGVVPQDALRSVLVLRNGVQITASQGESEIVARPLAQPMLAIGYHLDYGLRSPIPAQKIVVPIHPDSFREQLAFARTFVLESEIQQLRSCGYGQRVTEKDILVIGPQGVIGNQLRAPDECVRHKVLDCLGDLALIGCDVYGFIDAYKSGHSLNQEFVRRLQFANLQPANAMDSNAG